MDIKCAALVLVLLTVTVEFSETLPLLCATCLKISREGIMTEEVADIQKRQKKSLKDADINLDEFFASADKFHSRHERSLPPGGGFFIKTGMKMRKREKKSLKDADINLDEFFASADKFHSRHERSLPPGGGFFIKTGMNMRKREKKSLKDADINLDEYLASGPAGKINSRHNSVPQEGKMTRKNRGLHSEVGKREQRSVEDADMNLDEYFPLGLADKLHSHYKGPPGL